MANLQELIDELALYKAARDRILKGAQEVRVGSQSYRFADLTVIKNEIASLERRIAIVRAAQGGMNITTSVPVFRGRR